MLNSTIFSFSIVFSTLSKKKIIITTIFNLFSANAFNFILSKYLSFGRGLKKNCIIWATLKLSSQFGQGQNFVNWKVTIQKIQSTLFHISINLRLSHIETICWKHLRNDQNQQETCEFLLTEYTPTIPSHETGSRWLVDLDSLTLYHTTKILERSKFKALADDNMNMTEKTNLFLGE